CPATACGKSPARDCGRAPSLRRGQPTRRSGCSTRPGTRPAPGRTPATAAAPGATAAGPAGRGPTGDVAAAAEQGGGGGGGQWPTGGRAAVAPLARSGVLPAGLPGGARGELTSAPDRGGG